MCKDCEGSSFGYKHAHMLHSLSFNSEFIHTTLDYLNSLPDRKDDWRFAEEWSWMVIGHKNDDTPKEHEGIWGHYLEHAYPEKYGKLMSVGSDGTIDNPCGKVCEF